MPQSLPAQMKCIRFDTPGPASVLEAGESELPVAGPDDVLIKVAAAGVNRPDILQREGVYPPPPGASPLMGLEVAGEIVAVGEAVTGWSIGDQVCALTPGGGYAEYCVTPAAQCLAVPKGYSMTQAAALPETFFTVWFNLFVQGGLAEGESLLVHGGSSGIGTTTIQLCRALGITVYTTAGSDEKCRACEKLGASKAFNYREQDYVEGVKELTQGKGVNMVLDMVGGDYIARNLKCLARKGRLVNIAYLQGSKVEINLMPVMLKQLVLTGSTLRPQPVSVKKQIADELLATVWPLLEKGEIAPVIHASFALAQVRDAHVMMEASSHIGKIMLEL